jgi:hypothetical protein
MIERFGDAGKVGEWSSGFGKHGGARIVPSILVTVSGSTSGNAADIYGRFYFYGD